MKVLEYINSDIDILEFLIEYKHPAINKKNASKMNLTLEIVFIWLVFVAA